MIDPPDEDRPLPPPPVEPLPDLAWARLERQLWQTLDTPVEERYERALALLGFDPRMLSQDAGHA